MVDKPPETAMSHGAQPLALQVRPTWIDRVLVLSVSGDIDALTAPKLTEAILAALADQPEAMVVDLSDVDFLASAWMSVLVLAHEQVTRTARFAVVADGPSTSRILKLVQLDQVFPIVSSLPEAIETVKRDQAS